MRAADQGTLKEWETNEQINAQVTYFPREGSELAAELWGAISGV